MEEVSVEEEVSGFVAAVVAAGVAAVAQGRESTSEYSPIYLDLTV